MCLYIDKRHPNLIEAKRSITVYKLLYCDEDDGSYKSVVKHFLYEPHQIVKSLIEVKEVKSSNDQQNKRIYVTTGLHAYRSLDRAMNSNFWYGLIVKMTIPKGAHYYLGTHGDIVSDTLETGNMAISCTEN